MESSIKEVRKDLEGKANIIAINTDHQENIELAQMFNVRVVPTLVFMDKDYNPIQIIEGAISKEQIYQYFTEAGVE